MKTGAGSAQAARELLALCLHAHLRPDRNANLRRFLQTDAERLDWPVFWAMAAKPRVPLVYQVLAPHSDLVPPEVLSELKDIYDACRERNGFLMRELACVLEALAEVDVVAVPLRGIALIEFVYADPGARHMNDIDVLIRREDLGAIEDALKPLGYRLYQEPRRAAFMKEHGVNICLAKDAPSGRDHDRVKIEFHWQTVDLDGLGHTTDIDHTAALESSRLVETSLGRVWFLPVNQLMINLCVHHFMCHTIERPMRVYDVAKTLTVRGQEVDWSALVDLATRYAVTSPVYWALYAAGRCFEIGVPAEVLRALRPPPLRRWLLGRLARIGRLCEMDFRHLEIPASSPIAWMWQFLMLDGLGRCLRVVLGLFFPGKPFLQARYPRTRGRLRLAMMTLCHPLRIMSVAAQAGGRLFLSALRRRRSPSR